MCERRNLTESHNPLRVVSLGVEEEASGRLSKGHRRLLCSADGSAHPPEICFSKVFDSKEERETWIAVRRSLVLLTRWHTDQSYVKSEEGT